MTLGEKLKKARLEKGLTQNQVAGDRITRNMLSQLEHDAAAPSVKTLEYLAEVLEVPVGWLLESHPEDDRMALLDRARERYRLGDYPGCAALLPQDGHCTEEEKLLLIRSLLAWAGQCLEKNHLREASQIAEQALNLCADSLYAGGPEQAEAAYILCRSALLLQENASHWLAVFKHACSRLQLESRGHLLQAGVYLTSGETEQAERELWAVSEESTILQTEQFLLRGRLELQRGQPQQAMLYLQQAEQQEQRSLRQQRELYALLEQCCREQEDYKQAYHYSVLQLQMERGETVK